nr:hypothetical protein [Tanacetum cinerariifolium]GFA40500.1 hypothetical protein [Tanacetum cinerariifolium]
AHGAGGVVVEVVGSSRSEWECKSGGKKGIGDWREAPCCA